MGVKATSNLGPGTESEVETALDRLRTARRADRVLVMEGGRVVEDGTYEALAGRDGPFAELIRGSETLILIRPLGRGGSDPLRNWLLCLTRDLSACFRPRDAPRPGGRM